MAKEIKLNAIERNLLESLGQRIQAGREAQAIQQSVIGGLAVRCGVQEGTNFSFELAGDVLNIEIPEPKSED
jgi:hypothetical protein